MSQTDKTFQQRLNSLFDVYADDFDEIYEKRTRGDYTARGFLASFLRDVDALRAERDSTPVDDSPKDHNDRPLYFECNNSDCHTRLCRAIEDITDKSDADFVYVLECGHIYYKMTDEP